MIKIGITGSLGSGKTTASKLIAKGRGPIFSADTAKSNAAVPLEQEIPYFLLTFLLKDSSNFSTKGPSDETHPVSIHSIKRSRNNIREGHL